jgi:hypothetical protein
MSNVVLASVVCGLVLLAGCGDQQPAGKGHPTAAGSECVEEGGAAHVGVDADLDGDGRPEALSYVDNPDCRALHAEVGGRRLSAPVTGGMALRQGELQAVQIPGRTGQLLLVKQQHPRGGFQARLFGYADGTFEELHAEGKPIFDFIATDVLTTPTAVECLSNGFAVTQARRHQPIGVVPAWDVYRTAYVVDGNAVTKGATSEVADNVLDAALQRQYGALVDYDFFGTCLVTS